MTGRSRTRLERVRGSLGIAQLPLQQIEDSPVPTRRTASSCARPGLQSRPAPSARLEAQVWQEVDRLQGSYHGAQQGTADELGLKRNQILRQTKRYRPAAQDTDND
ncbi:hypothetical protein ABT001_32675 [Streptomyces sp. NPDC002793]|uniref:hypothetical protein n=1 Tax=Streptomyces sp. NPDC002793 TaxID=3154432 RepID=UPI003320425D